MCSNDHAVKDYAVSKRLSLYEFIIISPTFNSYHEFALKRGSSNSNDPNGAYVLVIFGSVGIDGHTLQARDGLGITETKFFTMDILEQAQVLVMDVPINNTIVFIIL